MRYLLFTVLMLCTACQQDKNQQSDFAEEENYEFSNEIFSDGAVIGEIKDSKLDELSGLAASQKDATVLWTHNDSGGKPVIYTISTSGESLGRFSLVGVDATDYEDIAAGKGRIFLGDIGDNKEKRDFATVYHFSEPDFMIPDITKIQKIQFTYPKKPRDAETLLYDPISDSLFILSKHDKHALLFSLPTQADEPVVARYQLKIPYRKFTAGDISPSGTEIIVKNYESILYWKRDSTETVAETMAREPILLPYTPEPQGESLAWLANGKDFVTVTEKKKGESVLLKRHYRNR